MGEFKETLGINEIKSKNSNLPKALLAEFLGVLLLNLFGCGSVVLSDSNKTVVIPLAFGLAIFVVVQALGHVSGAHLNPAVTTGLMSTGTTPILRGVLYIVVQCLGALAGSGLLKALTPEKLHQFGLGNTAINYDVITALQAFGIEFFLGFILVLTVCGVCDPNKPEMKSTAPLAIGLAVALGHLTCMPFTGASMNPARSFGSAVIANIWDDHWVYWAGPIFGGIAAALLYKHAFQAPSLGPLKIIERYTTVVTDEKELKRLDGARDDLA
ncbi:unnamed protein product [Callosobruchus maculatus]|uniref:Aquaporin n=1 Tax=Callosobruchus maculatus TaxID=64391 RepID=A0A653D5T0_CALMS|nr:unnamed protein product [Callosobruchus maculatus]